MRIECEIGGIMKKTHEEVKKALVCCTADKCKQCPYFTDGNADEPCLNSLFRDTLSLIFHLEAKMGKAANET